jgi:hypothetical protein
MLHHSFGGTADEQVRKSGPAVGTDDDELKVFFLGQTADFLEGDTDRDPAGQFDSGNILAAAFGLPFQLGQSLAGAAGLYLTRLTTQSSKSLSLSGRDNIQQHIGGGKIIA